MKFAFKPDTGRYWGIVVRHVDGDGHEPQVEIRTEHLSDAFTYDRNKVFIIDESQLREALAHGEQAAATP